VLTLIFSVAPARAQSPDRELRGQLLNAAGEPVKDATIRVRAVSRESGTRYGETEDLEPNASTDAKGEFVIRGKTPFKAATVTAEAPGYAKGVFTELVTGGPVHTLNLLKGVSVVGSVVKNGGPVANVKIGISDTDRFSKIFTVDLSATTDAQGRFRIENVPPRRDYFLFGFMHSFADKGALASRRINAQADGSVLDVGELNVEPAFILDGRLSTPLPHIQVLLSRNRGRDALTAETGALGQFHFAGVPGDALTVSVDVPGHRLTLRNASLNPADPSNLLGRIVTNKTDLLIDVEAGTTLEPLSISAAAASEESLRGAEPPTAGPNTLKITGSVVDAESGEKIGAFVTTEGRLNAGGYDWFFTRAHRHQNGEFTTYATAAPNAPVLIVQADNHLPWISGPITTETNFNVKLAQGVQAKGVVRKPEGQVATNITVYLASPYGHTRIENFGVENTAPKVTTNARGEFTFPPQADAVAVMVYDAAGFAETPIDELLKTGEVQLKPLARVEGNLRIGPAAGTNEVIHLSTAPAPYHWYPLELPAYSITLTTRTDTNGNFTFERVPPTWMEIAHSPTVTIETASGATLPAAAPAGAFRLTQTQRIHPKPGETMRVTIGGRGRTVIGRVELEGGEGQIDWRGSPQTMELVVMHDGPSDAAMKSLTEKLLKTQRPGATKAERDAAEKAYNDERRAFSQATRKFFSTETGMAALMASRRYFLQFDSEGAFRIEDVPPGKYRITGLLANNNPAAFSFARKFLGQIDAEVAVREGSAPFDVGVIKAKSLARSN
jgi:hypothetical protein